MAARNRQGLASTPYRDPVAVLSADDVFYGSALLFVLLSGLVFFGWGEIFSLFPSTLTDTFGMKNATRNYGCLYMAQGIGAIFGGPMASLLHDATGNWISVFGVAIAADILTAVLAIAVLKPMRAAYLAR